MERDAAEVLRDALALSPEVRAALIDSLISSLDQAVDAAAEEAWREEIYRRLQQIDSGVVHLIFAPTDGAGGGSRRDGPRLKVQLVSKRRSGWVAPLTQDALGTDR